MNGAISTFSQASQPSSEAAASTSEPNDETTRAISEFSADMGVYAAALENAYLHARNNRRLAHGTYRRWQRPAESDDTWSTQVVRWVRNTLTGPWCVSEAGATTMCLMLEGLLDDSEKVSTVELRLITGSDYELVVFVVVDRREDDIECIRLVGDFVTGSPDALIRHYMPLALAR